MTTHTVTARGMVRGRVQGEALVCRKAFSFLGDVDMDSGEIIAHGHEHEGESIAGRGMIYPETKGSSGGCVVLMSLYRNGKQPGAIVNIKMADYNLVEGAILARVPLACLPEADPREHIRTGDLVRLNGADGTLDILERRT